MTKWKFFMSLKKICSRFSDIVWNQHHDNNSNSKIYFERIHTLLTCQKKWMINISEDLRSPWKQVSKYNAGKMGSKVKEFEQLVIIPMNTNKPNILPRSLLNSETTYFNLYASASWSFVARHIFLIIFSFSVSKLKNMPKYPTKNKYIFFFLCVCSRNIYHF